MRVGLAVLPVAVGLCLLVGLAAGTVPLTPVEVWHGLWRSGSSASVIVRDLRAPRVLLAFCVGGSLAVCGAALQAMIRNPLAEPYLLGLSGGAGLGAVIAIATQATGPWAIPVAAFARRARRGGAGVPAEPRGRSPARPARAAAVGRGGGLVRRRAHERHHGALRRRRTLRNAFLWLLGGFGAASWQALGVFSPMPWSRSLIIGLSARSLDLLALGEEPAHHLGADVDRTRRVVYLCTALLTAASVAACGIIGFVGLVVPHAVRTFARPIHRTLLPLVFVIGGSFLVLSRRGRPHGGTAARAAGRRDHRAGRRPPVRRPAPADARVIIEARGRDGAVPVDSRDRRLPA